MTSPGLVTRSRAAQTLTLLARPDAAAVIAQLPPRPGAQVAASEVRARSGLDPRRFWGVVADLRALRVLVLDADHLALGRDGLADLCADLVTDSPLIGATAGHPGLRRFVEHGRWRGVPNDEATTEEMYQCLSQLFSAGEVLPESEVNARISPVHDDPAEVRRGLCDRGLLRREPGSATYHVP